MTKWVFQGFKAKPVFRNQSTLVITLNMQIKPQVMNVPTCSYLNG